MLKRKINYVEMTPEVYVSVEVIGGTTRQIYSTASGQWMTNRTLDPLVLRPRVGYHDKGSGTRETDASARLTEGRWYRLTPGTTGGLTSANEITSGGNFTIDTASTNYGELTVRENTAVGTPVTYVFVATLNAGERKTVMGSVRCVTKGVDVMPELMLDNVREGIYNPWGDSPTFTVTPYLTPSTYPATYRWESLHGGKWGVLGSTHYDWALTFDRVTGKLTLRRDQMQDELILRCVAAVNIDGTTVELTKSLAHKRRLPDYSVDIAELAAPMTGTATVQRTAVVRTNRGTVQNPEGELGFSWYGSGSAPIATGRTASIRLSSLGSAMELGLDWADRGGWKALETADGKYLTDQDGKVLLVR